MPNGAKQTMEYSHEIADVSGRRIVWTAAGLVATLVVVALAAWAVLALIRAEQPQGALPSLHVPLTHTTTPQLQSSPERDLRALREEKHAMLSGYRWLDRRAGVAQIPIDRAMQLMAARSQTASRDIEKASESPQ